VLDIELALPVGLFFCRSGLVYAAFAAYMYFDLNGAPQTCVGARRPFCFRDALRSCTKFSLRPRQGSLAFITAIWNASDPGAGDLARVTSSV